MKSHRGKRSVMLKQPIMKYKLIIFFAPLQMISSIISAQASADDIAGVCLTGGKEPAKIQVFKSGDKYYGKIIWLKYPEENGKLKVDSNNPDKIKRSNQIVGLIILKGSWFDGKDGAMEKSMILKVAKLITAIYHSKIKIL